ncbi:uncharacterized protein LOC132300814 [Cornus florida]|uniref:uncharacterized protein LOC132300814 n=1 Tax=Cornus florida TaxID=4283 RepID=UPI00289F0281|nr:uncharacterized protein LOC132300814 [Cornus florida]
MAEAAEETIMEERDELMISPKGGDPTLRIAHFLKPSVTSIDGPFFNLPSPSLSSVPANFDPTKSPLRVSFNGWRQPSKNWKTWVSRMHSSHQSLWENVGIHDAIMNSTYKIWKIDSLVFGFVERWCSDTNTFVFPWAETTITLEDIIILGGYSALGDSISTPLETTELNEIKEQLVRARSEISRSKAHKASHERWLSKFMGCGSEIEHEAFLSYWLSRFVFPTSFNSIATNVFPIANHLARGTKIALAPPVLASLYRDLSLLKATIVASNKLGTSICEEAALTLAVWAPLQFVQIWAWERFTSLRPTPCSIGHGGPRLARWDNAKKVNIEDMRLAIDSAGSNFLWRPYARAKKGEWLLAQPVMDEGLESLALCLRVCELVGLGCIEQYLPHRVAMQFGLDQDLPGLVARSNSSLEIAWSNYKRPIRDEKLYISPRHYKPGVTTRYFEWWNAKFGGQEATKHVFEKRNSNSSERTPQSWKITDPAVPPGFPSKSISVESSDSSAEYRQPLSEWLRNMKSRGGQSSIRSRLQSPSPSSTADSGTIQKIGSVVKPAENIVEREHVMEGSAAVTHDAMESRTELVTHDAIISRTEMIAESAIVSRPEMIAEGAIVSRSEMIAEDAVVTRTEMIAEDAVVSRPEMIAEGAIVSRTEMITEDAIESRMRTPVNNMILDLHSGWWGLSLFPLEISNSLDIRRE